MQGYYVVMAKPLVLGPANGIFAVYDYEEYSGHHWDLDQELDAHEELWDAQHDGEVVDPYIKEVII